MCTDRQSCNAAIEALKKIKYLLDDDTLSDSDCIEQICRVYETLAGMPEKSIPRHDEHQ